MNRINITTLGCPKNTADSRHLARTFRSEGFIDVDNSDEADILLVNTCGFIKDAKEESIEEIIRLASIKGKRKKLVVFGCLAKRYKDDLLKEIPEIDCIWGVGEENEIIEYCKKMAKGNPKVSIVSSLSPVVSSKNLPIASCPLPFASSYAYLKIAEGCDKKCTFCVIPSIRGVFRSIRPELIMAEAGEHISAGVKELILVAQDITSYGKDLDGYDLVALLHDLASLPEIFTSGFCIFILLLSPTH